MVCEIDVKDRFGVDLGFTAIRLDGEQQGCRINRWLTPEMHILLEDF